MKPSDELHQLIRSMSRSEKRHFSMQTSLQGGGRNYLLLFEAIERMEIYDEAKLKRRLTGRMPVTHLSTAKRYLHDLILKTLRSYHTGYTVEARAGEMLDAAEILHARGLDDQAMKLVDRTIRLASENAAPLPLLEALRLAARIRGCEPASPPCEQLIDDMHAALDALGNEVEHEKLMRRMVFRFQHDHPRTREQAEGIDGLMRHPLLREESMALSLKAKANFYTTLGLRHFGCGDYDAALETTDRLIELFQAKPEAIPDNIVEYRSVLHNRMLLQRRMLDFGGWREALDDLRRKIAAFEAEGRLKNRRAAISLYNTLYVNLICYCTMVADLEMGRRILPEVQEWLGAHEHLLTTTERIVFYSNISLIYFALGEYVRSLDYVNRVLETEPYRAKDIYFHARLMELILHFELGNIEIIPYRIRSTYRFYRSQNAMYGFESLILDFFRRLLRVATMPELIEEFARLKRRLEESQDDPDVRRMFEHFDYLNWLESRITGRSYAELAHAATQSYVAGLPDPSSPFRPTRGRL